MAIGYVAGWRLVRLLPERTAYAGFRLVADRIHARRGRGVQRLRGNLTRLRPGLGEAELDGLTRDAVRSYLRYWCESFRLPRWSRADLMGRTVMLGEDRLRREYAAGRGVVVALPHMANWDWAGAWACATGMPLTTVAERLRPERLYDEFVAYRASLGMEILALTGGSPPYGALLERVRAGGLVCLLADRDLSRTSVPVDLAGSPARMPRGPAALARATGAPLLPVTLAYRGERMEVTIHPAVPPGEEAAMTQGVADAFGRALRADPVDWHMMQRVFAG